MVGATLDTTWLSQMRKGILELCVLAVVTREETYGYAIVEKLGQIPGMEVTESTVYPLLARLCSEGLLKHRMAKSPNGPARRYYSLSAPGQKRLSELSSAWGTIVDSVSSLLSPREASVAS
jgi:PadR family transcriptional regulator, regulatory protein PadR